MRSCSGASVAQALPTQSASVETSSAMPSAAKARLCRVSGRCVANLSQTIIASRPGPARPRAMAWCGAGGCVMASQARQLNFSRTVCTTFHCLGTTSSVSVTSSPSLTRSPPPQQEQASGEGSTTRSRGRSAGSGARLAAAGEGAHRGIAVVGFALARILARRCLHLLQLQFQLIQQVAAPFRGLAVPLSTQLRDQQLQMFDLGFRPCPGRPFLGQRSAQGGDLGGGVWGAEDIMGGSEPEPAPARQPCSST